MARDPGFSPTREFKPCIAFPRLSHSTPERAHSSARLRLTIRLQASACRTHELLHPLMDLYEELREAATQKIPCGNREHDSAYDDSTSGRE